MGRRRLKPCTADMAYDWDDVTRKGGHAEICNMASQMLSLGIVFTEDNLYTSIPNAFKVHFKAAQQDFEVYAPWQGFMSETTIQSRTLVGEPGPFNRSADLVGSSIQAVAIWRLQQTIGGKIVIIKNWLYGGNSIKFYQTGTAASQLTIFSTVFNVSNSNEQYNRTVAKLLAMHTCRTLTNDIQLEQHLRSELYGIRTQNGMVPGELDTMARLKTRGSDFAE